ncbi:phosphate-starvation-inducible PsiE family protein, partial [Acidithiobacillus thiooxidans]
ERFEQIFSIAISFVIMVVIVLAFGSFLSHVVNLLEIKIIDINNRTFSTIFGSIMSLLIALEFNHTIFHSIKHRGQIVRVKTVVLIAILVIAREFVLLDTGNIHSATVLAYAISAVCLGVVYYILDVRERIGQDE